MSESKLPEGVRERYSREFVMVYGVDVREMDREDLIACIGMAMSQNASSRMAQIEEREMHELVDRYRTRACI